MRHPWLLILTLCAAPALSSDQGRAHQGTIIRMRMAECLPASRGFMASISGNTASASGEVCPEYVLVSDKVVYVIVGKSSTALVPLAEVTRFRLAKNELIIRIDDADHETRFIIREMVLRSEWDRIHSQVVEEQEAVSGRREREAGMVLNDAR